jgi:O-acetyl-ADP-ribose deacetylase (regulator of RNase III)
MEKYREIEGDLIALAKKGEFDVIVHGANCFCKMKRGLAPQMAEAFGCDRYTLEGDSYKGDMNKLGNIDFEVRDIDVKGNVFHPKGIHDKSYTNTLIIINAYTQYHWDTATKPLDYAALELCLKKINYTFKDKHIGLPQIGCHLAGGDWNIVKKMIKNHLKDCQVTVVIYKP